VNPRASGEYPVEARVRVTSGNGAVPDDAPREVTVRAKHVLVTSHVPFVDRFRLWSKLYPYRSYVIAARVPHGRVPDALYWDTRDPYHYARVQPGEDEDVILYGGEDHKVGQQPDGNPFEKLEITLRESLRIDFDVEWQWSAQDPETVDGLPFVGVNPGSPAHELVATGYGGNGMTFGPLAAWMLAERVAGRSTRWDDILDPSRKSARHAGTFLRENMDYPLELARGYFTRRRGRTPLDLAPGEGVVVTRGRRKVAVARDPESGAWHAVNAACTHMGCVVNWNAVESSWDCPCHGSRFRVDGEVLNGPAAKGLEPVDAVDVGVTRDAAPQRRR
jgi:nitrite reductase/ring-hydroxylating ferredoxin subunit